MNRIVTKINTFGYSFRFTLLNHDGTPYDTTESTVYFKMWKPGEWQDPVLIKECSVVDAAAGICDLFVEDGDFDQIGTFLYELEVTTPYKKDAFITGEIAVKESP